VYPSDRNAKKGFVPVNEVDVLKRVASLPMSTWTFKTDSSGTRHMGPMAQDFHAAFGLGGSEHAIDTGDVIGVSVAAIQGLNKKVASLEAKSGKIDAENQELRRGLDRLEAENRMLHDESRQIAARLDALKAEVSKIDHGKPGATSNLLRDPWSFAAGAMLLGIGMVSWQRRQRQS
jgi:hypothetical protein